MIVVVQGTSQFNDYNVFLRSMSVALSSMPKDDKEFYIYSAGPARVNSFVSEFSNLSERGMKSRGMKIKFYKVGPDWVEENMSYVNYFIFLSKENEKKTRLVGAAELSNVEVGIFRY